MSATESSSSSSSRHSSPASSPEIPKKDSGSPKNLPEVPKSPESPPEIPKKASQPQEKTPEIPKKTPKSSQSPPEIPRKGSQSQETAPEIPKKGSQSQETAPEIPRKGSQSQEKAPEIPKKGSQSQEKAPVIPRKGSQSQEKAPEIPKKAFQTQKTPEIPKKALQSPQKTPEIPKKVLPSPQKTPEIPKKALQSPQKTPEIPKKALQSPQKTPEIPKKASQSPRSPGTLKQDPKSSPENREKITSSPSVPSKESKVSDSPKSSERPNTSHKSPLSSPESPRDEHTAPTGESKAFPKKINGNRSFKSSLQVFLQQKHDTELQKTIEYKAKLERGEESDEDDDIEKEGEDKEGDKVMKERKSEGPKDDNKEKVEKSVEEEQAKSNKPTKTKEEASDANQTKEEKAKKKSKVEKEKKEKEQDRKTIKEKTKSPEITPRKKQKEETKKKEDTREEPKKKATKEDMAEKEEESKKKEQELSATKKEEVKATVEEPAEEEEKKTKKKEEAVSMKKKEGLRDERTQGHLHLKKKRTFNPWKEYYFVLDGLLLTYYRSQHDYERLSSMKGSFDLTLVEEVCAKKPGLMKTHHPFCLARRNLPSIKLAAETKQEQERWMEAVKTAVGPRRLSCYSSDKTLNSGTSPANYPAKSATLPGRGKDVSTYSSSITEEEEDEEKKEVKKEEEKKEEEEDALLIKPKKLPRTPIGMPIFKPNLDQVKLKNVERKEVKTEDVEEGKAADASSSPSSPHESHRKEDPSREASVSGVFGVVLKKAKNKEEVEEEEVEKQEEIKESSDAGSGHEGQASPGHATSSNRRPLKQPVIPLNNKKLLVLPEVKESKSPRVSPGTQKRSTVDRKKSPSPSLPISKSVQTLTKLAEEVKATQMDTTSSADTTSAEEWKGKDGEVKVCHAQTSEVTYSDVVDLLDMEEEAEELIKDRKQGNKVEEKDETSENECKVINEIEKQKQEEDEGAKKVLDTAVKVDENEKEGEEENKEVVVATLKEEALNENTYREESLNKYNTNSEHVVTHKDEASPAEHKSRGSEMSHSDALPESSSVATPLTPPASPASSEASTNSEAGPKAALSSTSFELVPPSKSSPHSPKQTLPLSGDRRDVEEKMHSTTQECKQMAGEKQEEESETMATYGPRDRSNTNESTTSSSGLEGAEKKPGKLKLLKNKLKSVSMKEKKEESAVQKEPEKKRRGSNTFSSLLQGKKSKEGSKKPAEELQPSQVEDTNGSRVMPPDEVTPPSESPILPKVEPVTVMPPVDVQVIPPSASQPCKEEPQEKHDAFLSSLGSAGDGMVTLRATETYGETRSSVYSCTSTGSRDDPPPSIPEKTYMRAPSPNHDVPTNNRPVTNLSLMAGEEVCDDEDDTNQRVDGYITQEQIEALLNANENRDKRKRSLSRNQPFAKPTSSNELIPKRPSYISCSSVDSDESQLPTTNFLSFGRQSSSSSSIKDLSKVETSERSSCSFSESGDSYSPDVEGPADSMRRAPRATDAIITKNRVSLTSPEFTVEEESVSSPETPKVKPTRDTNVEDDNANKNQHDSSEDESEAECKDFFPVVGGDVQFREPAPLNLPTGNLRTSGIVGLKEYLEAQEEKEDFQDVKSCISRLGHSAAVEKLKQTASEQ